MDEINCGGVIGTGQRDIHQLRAPDYLLMSGSGPSSPAEYEQPGYVDAAIVADIIGWISEN